MHLNNHWSLYKQHDVVIKGCFVFKHCSLCDYNLRVQQSHCVNISWKKCADVVLVLYEITLEEKLFIR